MNFLVELKARKFARVMIEQIDNSRVVDVTQFHSDVISRFSEFEENDTTREQLIAFRAAAIIKKRRPDTTVEVRTRCLYNKWDWAVVSPSVHVSL